MQDCFIVGSPSQRVNGVGVPLLIGHILTYTFQKVI